MPASQFGMIICNAITLMLMCGWGGGSTLSLELLYVQWADTMLGRLVYSNGDPDAGSVK